MQSLVTRISASKRNIYTIFTILPNNQRIKISKSKNCRNLLKLLLANYFSLLLRYNNILCALFLHYYFFRQITKIMSIIQTIGLFGLNYGFFYLVATETREQSFLCLVFAKSPNKKRYVFFLQPKTTILKPLT